MAQTAKVLATTTTTTTTFKADVLAQIAIVSAHLRVAGKAFSTFKLFVRVTGESSKFALEANHM